MIHLLRVNDYQNRSSRSGGSGMRSSVLDMLTLECMEVGSYLGGRCPPGFWV